MYITILPLSLIHTSIGKGFYEGKGVYEGDWQNDEIHSTAEVTCTMMFIILPLSLMMDGMDRARKKRGK